jgi:hypothetical protein
MDGSYGEVCEGEAKGLHLDVVVDDCLHYELCEYISVCMPWFRLLYLREILLTG